MTAANLLARSRGPLWNPTFSFPIKTFNTKKTFVDVRCAQQQRWIDCRASTILAIHFDARAWSAMRLHRAGCHESYVSYEKWFIGRHIAKLPLENSRVRAVYFHLASVGWRRDCHWTRVCLSLAFSPLRACAFLEQFDSQRARLSYMMHLFEMFAAAKLWPVRRWRNIS